MLFHSQLTVKLLALCKIFLSLNQSYGLNILKDYTNLSSNSFNHRLKTPNFFAPEITVRVICRNNPEK